MASTYKIYFPNGANTLLPYGTYEEKLDRAKALIDAWEPYLEGNWISTNYTDVLCGENKVKRFLDGLAYYLLLGSEGIVTDYKELMNGKREIPVSSCPQQISDMVYGTGCAARQPDEESTPIEDNESRMKITVKTKKPRSGKSKRELNLEMIRKTYGRIDHFRTCIVDTDNNFSFNGDKYHIDESVTEYAPKHTALGDLYDMDAVYVFSMRGDPPLFTNANYEIIDPEKIKKI